MGGGSGREEEEACWRRRRPASRLAARLPPRPTSPRCLAPRLNRNRKDNEQPLVEAGDLEQAVSGAGHGRQLLLVHGRSRWASLLLSDRPEAGQGVRRRPPGAARGGGGQRDCWRCSPPTALELEFAATRGVRRWPPVPARGGGGRTEGVCWRSLPARRWDFVRGHRRMDGLSWRGGRQWKMKPC